MSENPLVKLHEYGQSIWLDFLRRDLYTSDKLHQLIERDGLRGMTSNPAIFDEAIAGSHDYDDAIRVLALEGKSPDETYVSLMIEDVRSAADSFRSVYDAAGGHDGLVSIEVSPQLAYDTAGTIAEARRFWGMVSRPNIMIKVPATLEGLPAIRQLLSEGINVNITLLFGLPRYRRVAEAFVAGLEDRVDAGQPIDRIASVASFFLSRIDVLVDPLLEKTMAGGGAEAGLARDLHGQVAISSAKIAYQIYREIFGSDRFKKLADKGARPQRLLWASTSTKNPAYSDVKYVEPLIGPDTVNTLPTQTLDAYRDHGNPASRIEQGVEQARTRLESLEKLGISLDAVTHELENEGAAKFIIPYNKLMETLSTAQGTALSMPLDTQAFELGDQEQLLNRGLSVLGTKDYVARFWRKDPRLWKDDLTDQAVIVDALGWLLVANRMTERVPELTAFAAEVAEAGFQHVVHMGMGGSSLTPLVFERSLAPTGKGLPLTVLDSTDPGTILRIARSVPLEKTLFIVASKSGTTAEPLAFGDYFYARLQELKGKKAGENFVSITDEGTPLVELSQERGYRRVFVNFSDIGGRYSALSYFGMLPAALMGFDVGDILARALRMAYACAPAVPAAQNPGVRLGALMGELARSGRNKVTFLAPPEAAPLGMWLEQLLAESTGKESAGLLPVAGEDVGDPFVYGNDRLFVHIRVRGKRAASTAALSALRQAGHPLVTIDVEEILNLAQEYFRWEIATAAAGALLGINAFNQPNVQESKDNTNRLLGVVKEKGSLPKEHPALSEEPLGLYTEHPGASVAKTLAKFLGQAQPGDYVALMAYVTEGADVDEALQRLRLTLRDRLKVATTVGYGPRFLHSTGQFHKGGPNTGLFLQLTADDAEDLDVPGRPYSFGVLKQAQAQGDLDALRSHGRRVIRIHLGEDIVAGLEALRTAISQGLDEG